MQRGFTFLITLESIQQQQTCNTARLLAAEARKLNITAIFAKGKKQGSHYILVLKFKDFSRTFKDPKVAFSRTNSRRKFTAWTVLQQYLMSVSVITGQF